VGHLGVLHGQRYAAQPHTTDGTSQNSKPKTKSSKNHSYQLNGDNDMEQPIIALFAVACLFGSSSLYEPANRDSMFKSKHKVSLAPVSFDTR
jgi:hypothetical protein